MPPEDHHAVRGPPHGPAVPRDVARAIDHMRRGLDQPLTAAGLARAAGVPERTLRKHFVAFLGHPPLAHLRRLRLTAAREALLRAGPGESVTAVAGRCGLPHLGRFASDYRRAFGEAPSATLARAARDGGGHVGAGRPSGDPPPIPAIWRQAPRLVVLPVRAESDGLGQRVLAELLTEQLAAALCRLRSVAVAVRHRPFGARPEGAGPTPADGGYRLAARLVRCGERVRVVLGLLDAGQGRHLWGDAFDGAAAEPFALVDRVVEAAVRAVQPGVQAAEMERVRRCGAPERLGARDLVLRAFPAVLAGDPASARRALALLEHAMDLDPDDALPTALAAWCRAQLVQHHAAEDRAAERARAVRLAGRAAVLDAASDPLVLAARASVSAMASAPAEAEALLARALAIDPHCAWAWERSGWFHAQLDATKRSLAHLRRAVRLRGTDLPRTSILVSAAFAHQKAERFGEAARWYRRVRAENPGAVWIEKYHAVACANLGDMAAGREAIARLRRACPAVTPASLLADMPVISPIAARRRELVRRDWAALGFRD